jgi:hypothetical protein
VILAEHVLGGLVRDKNLEPVLRKQLQSRRQNRIRNWELLRQRCETEDLYFQPIGLDEHLSVAAMVWISRHDLQDGRDRAFRSRFLSISDPWRDPVLRTWSGYTETWHFDADGLRIEAGDAARSEEMVPLALYSLDHPKVPFLLIDFRSRWKPAAREVARRTIEEVPSTVLGVATFANWEYRGAQEVWKFIRARRGAAIHRPDRLRAAAAVRQIILSAEFEPELREYLTRRLGATAPSSFQRYDALRRAVDSSGQLASRLHKDRGRELASLLYPNRSRWLNLATVASLGLYRYRISPTPERVAVLDRERRLLHAERVIEQALAAGATPDAGPEVARIHHAARELATLDSVDPGRRRRAMESLQRLVSLPASENYHDELLAILSDFEKAVQNKSTVGAVD